MSKKTMAIAILILALVAAAIIWLAAGKPAGQDRPLTESSFPQTIQGLSLGQVVSGPQAVDMISKLHGTGIEIKQGYIAQYGGSNGQIMIWISESGSTSDAKKLFDIMDEKIAAAQQPSGQQGSQQGPPFTNRRLFSRNGKDIVAVNGMGMENYYYRNGTKVYWVAVGGASPLAVLDEVMKSL